MSRAEIVAFSKQQQTADNKQNSKVSSVKMLTYDQKVLMAQMIFNEKDILFGEFGPDLTKVEKQEKWMEILVKLNSIGANVSDYKVSLFFLTKFKVLKDL